MVRFRLPATSEADRTKWGVLPRYECSMPPDGLALGGPAPELPAGISWTLPLGQPLEVQSSPPIPCGTAILDLVLFRA